MRLCYSHVEISVGVAVAKALEPRAGTHSGSDRHHAFVFFSKGYERLCRHGVKRAVTVSGADVVIAGRSAFRRGITLALHRLQMHDDGAAKTLCFLEGADGLFVIVSVYGSNVVKTKRLEIIVSVENPLCKLLCARHQRAQGSAHQGQL